MKENQEYNYTLYFAPIQNKNGRVSLVENHNGIEEEFGFIINDQDFEFRLQPTVPSVIADLVDIAASIHVSDRLVPQDLRKEDIVVRCSETENLTPSEMRQELLRLYKNYMTEWDTVEAQISASLSPPIDNEKSLVTVQ